MSNSTPKTILLIHGEKPSRNKALHPAFEERLKLALRLITKNKYDLILISGGQTRHTFLPESEIGYQYLKNKTDIPILQENRSITTIENITFSKNLLRNYKLEKLDVVTSNARLFRDKYLYQRLWPELIGKFTIYGANDFYFFLYPLIEIIYLLYAMIDIHDAGIPKLTKKLFRNAARN